MPFIEILDNHYQKEINLPIVACFCADWCGVCSTYKQIFMRITKKFPDITFLWIEVEKNSKLSSYYELDEFPTILIEDEEGVRFFGAIKTLEGVLSTILKRCFSFEILEHLPTLKKSSKKISQE